MMQEEEQSPRPSNGVPAQPSPPNGQPVVALVGGDFATLEAAKSVEQEASSDAATTATVSEYERKRLARVAQNAQFLLELGVKQAQREVLGGVARVKKVGRPPKRVRDDGDQRAPRVSRRSRRIAGKKEEYELNGSDVIDEEDEEDGGESEVQIDDSNVYRYTCSSVSSPDAKLEPTPGSRTRSLVGFQQRQLPADTYKDPFLTHIHAIGFSPFQENAVIAAGGTQGSVAVYSDLLIGEEDVEWTPPMLSFQAHEESVSCLSLGLSTANVNHLLLSAGMHDGVVKLWDLDQSDSGVPKEVLKSHGLHSRGILGMEVQNNQLLTCSTDATVVLSSFGEGARSLTVTRKYQTHVGHVRSARFSPLKPHVFASAGKDRVVRVYDTRERDTRASQEISRAHTRTINSVRWHPTQRHLLLTAGIDAHMHLFDLRYTSKPLVVMNTTHSQLKNSDYRTGFDPCFVAGGAYVVSACTTKQDKMITLHSTRDGMKISVGDLQGTASSLALDPSTDRLLLAVGSRLQSYDFRLRGAVTSTEV